MGGVGADDGLDDRRAGSMMVTWYRPGPESEKTVQE